MCVSSKGQTKVSRGTSECVSDSTSHAVAVNDGIVNASGDSLATAVNGSAADASYGGSAKAVNGSSADANGCTATAINGEEDICP